MAGTGGIGVEALPVAVMVSPRESVEVATAVLFTTPASISAWVSTSVALKFVALAGIEARHIGGRDGGCGQFFHAGDGRKRHVVHDGKRGGAATRAGADDGRRADDAARNVLFRQLAGEDDRGCVLAVGKQDVERRSP